MPIHLLPRLKKDYTVKEFDKAGIWEKRDSVVLESISESLDVADTKIASAEVDSIPSMWARPLLFEMALYEDDTNHPIHKRILGEWRGLLAMLALKEWCDFDLTIEQININDMGNPPDANDFLKALQKLIPKDALDGKTTWETLNIILFNEKPIGITSPTTLVCTSVNYSGRISGVPWFNGKFLDNPVPELNSFEKDAVAGWLKHLYEYTMQIPDGSKLKANINGLLFAFINELDGGTAVPTLSKIGLGLTQDLYKSMNNPVEPRELPSSVELIPSKNKQPNTKLLIPDQTIPKTWGVEPQNVFAWNCKTLATTQSFSGKPKLVLPQNIHLRSQKDFFTDKLFVINQEKAFHQHSTLVSKGSEDLNFNGIPVTPILPITEELLTYLDVRDLNERITFDQQNDSIVVSLRLTLSGINGQNLDFIISKEYGAENVNSIPTGPVLAIWPNFRTPDWKAYYTYFTTADQDTFYAKPFLAAGETSDSETFLDNQENIEKEITKTERFPEAMLCEYNGIKAGILPISVPEEPLSIDGTDWTIGVDFGTSSTTVYRYRKGDDTPQRVVFNDRLLHITDPLIYLERMFHDDFLSPKREQTPFFSLFQKLKNKEKPDEPLLDGHIYFLENYESLSSAKNIIDDLKWSNSAIDREHLKVFLKQLCLQCAAEAINDGAKKVNWNFSHPLAFTELDRGHFEHIWKTVGLACLIDTGLPQEVVTPAQSESVVTAKYFAKTLLGPLAAGGFTTGAVCIDIGGETSDVSIWQNNELYWQTSLRFAGRHIFLNLLKENPVFLKNFGADDRDIKLLEKATNGANDKFYAQADALIKEKGQEWLNKLATVGGEPAIQPFFQLISLSVAGLLYYVGLLLNHLSHSKANFNSEMPSIYIGGNGSKILHWMAHGSFNPDNPMALLCRKHLKHVIRKASGFESDNNRGIEISRSPKEEAAYGLVAGGIKLKPNATEFNILAGEAFTQTGRDYKWTEILTAERLKKRVSVSEDNLGQIQNFIDNFNAGLGAEINMPVDLNETLNGESQGSATVQNVIFEKLENVLQVFSDAKPEEISVEPLFILALKALLEAKIRRWKNTAS